MCVSIVPVAVIYHQQNVVESSKWLMIHLTMHKALKVFLRQCFHDALLVALFCSGAMSVHMLLFLNGTFNITLTMVCAPPAFSKNKRWSV